MELMKVIQFDEQIANSASIKAAEEFMYSPAARAAQELANSPAMQDAVQYVNSPDYQGALWQASTFQTRFSIAKPDIYHSRDNVDFRKGFYRITYFYEFMLALFS